MAARKHGTLVAATVATVTINAVGEAVEVVSLGSSSIYFTVDGSVPTVQGDDTFSVAPGGFNRAPNLDRDGTVVVKLISAGTPDYSVEVITG